jgi:hypothetical protein
MGQKRNVSSVDLIEVFAVFSGGYYALGSPRLNKLCPLEISAEAGRVRRAHA